MTRNFDLYCQALDGFDTAIRAVPDDAWESPSPCTKWAAVDVAGHVIDVQRSVARMLTGAEAPAQRPSLRERAGDDPVASWTAARADLLVAARPPGALERVAATPFGEMPVDDFLGIIVLDALTHTWDLGRAAKLDVQLDPELVALCSERIRPLDAAIRRPGFFEPARPAPEGADPQTELMAFLGREV